jgi:hypothetical protein
MKSWNINFHKWKGIWIQKEIPKTIFISNKKAQLWWNIKMKKLETRSIVCNKGLKFH